MAVWKRCLRLFRPDVRADVDDELRFHLEARIADYEAHGCAHADAVRMARDRFGDPEHVRRVLETHDFARQRRQNRKEYVAQLLYDVRIAIRSLRRTPAFSLTVVATLAIGIGANTSVFSVVSRELLDPLPYHDSARLVLVCPESPCSAHPFVSPREIDQLQRFSNTLASVAPFGLYSGYIYVGDRETLWWEGASVGPNFFQTLGVRPELGRLIDARDVEPGAAPVVVLSHAVWVQAFASDPTLVGRTISLNGARWRVIGVTAPDFVAPERAPQIWTPLDLRPFLTSPAADQSMLQAVGRLRDAAAVATMQAEVRLFGQRATARRAPRVAPSSLVAVPIREALVGDARPILLVIMGAALLVLVLASVNVAGLFLARAAARGREMAVRAALGAGRWRIARQLMTEAMVLGLTGGAAGLVFAYWGRTILVRLGGRVLPATGAPASIDGPVLVFAGLISLAAGGASGLIPALFSGRRQLTGALADGNRSATPGRTGVRAGRLLVAGQMAVAVLLLVVAGLLGRTLFALDHRGLGFEASRHVLSVTLVLPKSYATPDARVQFFSDWLDRLRNVPGVGAAGLVDISPWNGWNRYPFDVERGFGGAATVLNATMGGVSDGYFAAVKTGIVSGRAFLRSDRAGSQPVAIVSHQFARAAWPDRDAVGERLRLSGAGNPWLTVVGVVNDVREDALSDVDASVYIPAWQLPRHSYEALIRTTADADALVPAVRDTVRAMDPTLPVLLPQTLDQVMTGTLTARRLPAIFTAAFAMLALVLAVLGIYGIVAYAVTLRTRELGLRAALGGMRGDIIRLVLNEGLRTAVIGTAIGALFAVVGARLLTQLLFGVTADDPTTFIAAALVLLAASTAACLIPARRATRINPVDALRSE